MVDFKNLVYCMLNLINMSDIEFKLDIA
eukprot:SAG31_NODE_860_length_11431_cov_8.068920_1_plen_27_part_10